MHDMTTWATTGMRYPGETSIKLVDTIQQQ